MTDRFPKDTNRFLIGYDPARDQMLIEVCLSVDDAKRKAAEHVAKVAAERAKEQEAGK